MNERSEIHSQADILVVDDTPANIRLLSNLLLAQGYSVRKALSGQMALTVVQTLPPDLILLDVNMPGINGYEVCQRLKENVQTRSVPIIFLSALDGVSDKVKAFQAGGVDYITKPFQFEEVLARIQTQLKLQSLQTQLQGRNEQLQQALSDLQQAQAQLVQQEKMVGLGQLVAGVAHEINNPINFIAGNLAPAREYFQSLLKLIQLYQQEYPNPTPLIRAAFKEIDLEFLIPDLKKLLISMQNGVDRVHTITLALRIFSRLDESLVKSVNLHEGIDSTLLLLQQRLQHTKARPAIDIVRNYGQIPPVICYPSQLNQVFLNLLNNAIDALDRIGPAPTASPNPTIWIGTELTLSQTVLIRVKDNGIGIPDGLRSRLFNPFYTTKPVGTGTGLGLAISYQIVVEKHKGQLTCHSVPGQGTEFIVEVPLHLQKR